MTLLEKALRENPQLDAERIVRYLCPCDLGYEQTPDGCTAATECIGKICGACWAREAEDRAVEDARPYGAMTGGEEAGADGV